MSTWNIYHKDGSKLTDVNGEQITVHGLEYSDSWMGECFLTINFKHEVPINFQIGDYIIYRNERFELNYEPGKDKQARPNTYGEGFVYDIVKFNALQDELARAEFLDVVLNDNELHYTALPKFPFFVQTLDDLLDRIQANLDEQIGAGLWKIYSRNKERSVQRGCLVSEWLSMYGEGTSDNVIESMSITIDSKTCWEALALVNEKWNVNFIVRGRNIYVGTTGIEAGHIFSYGLGKGLYEIVQNADSDQSVITRLRAYGSEKNLPSHYYADLGVKYVANITKVVTASTNVELELDVDYIETYFKNKRKYVVSGESQEQSFGWVLQVTFDFQTTITGYVTQSGSSGKCRFYSELKGTQTDTGDEESKEKLDTFISQVKAGNTKMYIMSGLNKKVVPSSMKEYAKNLPNNMSINRLMLPGFPHVSLSDFYDSLTEQEKKYVNPTGKLHKFSTDPYRPYIDSLNIEEIGLRSASQFFDTDDKTNGVIEIYPTIEEMEIGGVRVDEIDEGVAPDDDGRFGDNETVKNVDIYLNKAIDFDINDLKDDDFSISMKDGMCGGRTFKVASSTKVDGRWRLTIERSKDDALELWFPYKDYPIKNGDHFVLSGITLPDSYVKAASLKLLKYAIALLDKNDYTRYVYQPKVDELFMARQHDKAQADETGTIKSLHDTLKAGDLMNFNDTDLNIEGIISIDQLTIKEEDGKIPTYDITLREDKEVGTIQKIQQQISSLQNGNGGTGAGLTTTQVKNQVATEGSKHFISKINDDTAKGTITWEKVQKLLSGLLVGNFNNENGGSWTPDAEGRSHLITDYLEVRMKAIFEELVINKTSTIGGKEIISPAGGVVAHKVEVVTVTYNNVSQKAYRCYFLAEQEGDAVDNDFAIGDQLRSESFNVRKGTYHKAGNHFYWRLVIGRDEEPVELEGKKYHYIDLSDTDCATASDVPAKGDVLSQCGNRTDVERQNCLIFSAVDTYSPSISLYHGINSYSFANKEYVEYGVHKQTNKAFFNVYGDMYVGDRPTKENGYEGSSYVKYDSATKQVTIKGKLSAKSTVDGKELSQYIKENSAGGLTEEQVNNLIKNSQVIADLQNQVDGAIETWFYDGVPTLKNAPASSWTTDKEKDTHLGDLYYDNKTGKAYRFAKDGNTYKWTIITDTDIAKALSDASKAQETADGKMKVFSTQPIPPYQLGDIWVNATYPTDGSIYKNEILRCQTAKAKGSSFAIADWTKASKYTDDSALNTFKEEYKNDMASYKEQLDEKVETWFYNYAPTTQNKPASDWTTDTLKSQHAGDLFYNTSNGYTYRWTGTAWARIKDNDINTAMTAASKAQDTADGKRTVFTSQPTVPYDEGDLWASGGDDGKTLMVCVKSRVTGSFTSSEWVKANDSDLNAFAKTIEESLTGIRDQLDKKAETWYQPSDPSTSWTTDDAKKEHKGDLWYNTSNNQTFFWNGTKWDKQDVPTEVFDKIDGKSSIYVSKPASYEERDLWILEAAYTLGGVAYSKGELVVATKSNASFSAADWTKKVKYTDDTVANAAKKAAEEAKKAADTAQTNVTNLGKTVTSNKKAFDNYVTDGYLEPSEIAAMAQDSKRLEDAFAAAEKSYTEVKEAAVLKDTKELTDLNTAFVTLSTAKTELIKYLSDISARYNAANTEGKANIVSAVGTKFTNFQSAYSAFYDKLGLANAYITSKIYGDLKQNITDLAGYKYIKDALGQTTDIDGGLVMTTLLALRDADGNVQSGINGAIDPNRGKKSIATWWGGQMVDKDYNSGSLTPATSLVRFDGSGYLANGAIWWDVDGKVHADPTSFIISEKNLGAYLTFFEPTWKAGSAGTSVADLVSLKPNAPFTKLGVSGDATFEGAISFHGIKLTYDATNKAIKIDGNLYATGGISAYGASDATSGGGGLNASVISYARIIEGSYTDADLTSIPNAYAIKALSSRIDNIATELGGLSLSWNNITGKPSTFAPSAHTHKWAEITDRITKVSQLTNDAGYLTAHQSLASYYTKAEIDAKGYTTNKGTVTSVALTLPTGLTCATKTITTSGTFAISLASGYSIPTTAKQTAWDGAVSAKHTHSNKSVLDGISSTKVSHWDSAYGWYALMTTDEETADGIINKWNEVVSFLANIAQTDTLSGIVDGINKSISDEVARAKKAEGVNASGISANKGSIATLQGYFTNGSAKKALQLTNARKLWGNSFNGTADINGSIIVPSGKYISIGNIKLEYDAANKALKITNTTTEEVANLYTSGGVSAYGVGASSSSGGGFNGSVKSYSNALKLTSESLSEIASAYSIKALDSRISSLEGGSAMDVSVSGSGNAVTAISKSGTTIIVTKGTTFLTSHQSLASYLTKTDAASLYQPKGNYLTAHQSLDGYVNAIAVSGSGNAVTAVTKSGKTITFTKGATYLTSHQSLSNYYTKSSVDSLLNGKSATTHTHSVKINGITKTIAASGGDAVDLGTYLTTHQSLAAYATQNWVKNEATAHNADMVDNYHASGLFTGFSISDVANKVTISIGGTSKALNLVRAFPSGVGNNFNDIATHGNSMGVSNIAAPYASSTANYQTLNGYVNPNGQTGWHHYINLSYTDSNNTETSPNMWQTQFAIKAGTTEVYVRSRDGGKISNSAAWAAPWVRLARVTDNVASASKVANALSWSGYSSGSYNGSAAKSISIPNNTNQLTNGAGFITASASISGNAGSATKLQNARTINGTSFNGTANIVTSYWGTTRKLWGNSVNGNADVNGSITIANTDGVYVQIGDVRLVYDKANTAIKVVKSDGTTAANFYATGGITAYGEGSGSSGGGGLNGSVKSYADALKLASESLSEIASAYSIKQLSTRITSLEGGSATSISVSGGGNAVTSVTKNGTTISVVKGSTFLTSHQSLSAYLKTENANNTFLKLSGGTISNNLIVNGSIKTNKLYLPSVGEGYIVSGVKDTNGSDFASVNCILKNWNSLGISSYDDIIRIVFNSRAGDIYLRGKLSAASLSGNLSWSYITDRPSSYTPSAHTHKWTEITDRPSSLKNPSALSWSGYSSGSYDGSAAKSISIPNNTNQLTNGAGFITASASITGNAATATKVNHSLSVFGKSFNGSADVTVADTDLIASISTATANLTDKTEILTSYASDNGFNDSNAKNRIYRRPASAIWGYINSKTISNADKLDNVHLNGIFTALSNTNNGVSMTIGTVAKSLANMQVYSATKLVTARNIALNGDLMGNANFDGSANITINGYMSYCNAIVSNTNTYPWRRIAKVNEITGNYSDGCILLYISEGFNGGYYGIARVCIRTDNLSTGANASCSIQWISRYGYGLDSLKIAMYKTTGKAYYDVFLKMRGVYVSVVIRTLQDQRGGLGKRFTLVNSTETTNAASHTEAYATIEDAATAIHNQAYTSIAQGYDVATVHNADMVDGIHANGLFTNLSNSGNSLSITVGGTNKTLTVNYASNAGNADTLDGVHASGLFTNLSNSGNNISITIGGTNKTLTAAYATNCDTVDGYHAGTSVKPYGTIPVIGTNGVIELGHNIDFHHDNTTGSDYSVRLQTNGNHSNVVTLPTATGTLALTSDNVASATKLQTTRTLWGQSFNGTANISGSMTGVGDMTLDAGARIKHGSGNLYIGNSDNSNWIGVQDICSQSSIGDGNWSLRTSGAAHFKDTTINGTATIKNLLSLVDGSHKGLKMGSTYISSLDGEVILQGNTALRFGNDAWDYNQWAGLKYDHSIKTVYLGIADGSIFKANSAQSGGVINLKQGISSVYTPTLYAGGDIYHTGAYRMLWKNSKASKYLNVMNISQDDNGILTIGYGNFSNNKNVVLEGYNLNFRVGNDSGTKSMWLNYNNGNPVLSLDGNFYATGGVTAYKSSDERLKHDIHGVDSLAIIKAMGGTVAFRYNADNKDSIGWIAQRVLHNTFMQDLVEKDDKGFLKINYWSPKLIAVAFGAIEQVDDEVSRLKARVVFLESEVQRLSGKQGSSDKKRLDNKNINLLN